MNKVAINSMANVDRCGGSSVRFYFANNIVIANIYS